MKSLLIAIAAVYFTLQLSSAQNTTAWPWGSTAGISKADFIGNLTNKLNVAELAQHLSLIKYTDFADKNGNATSFLSVVGNRGIGELNFWTPKDSNEYNVLQKLVIETARVPVPLMQGGECLHSSERQNTTIFPISLDMASTWNLDLMQRIARTIATETRAVGQVNCYAPVLDLAKDARWGRNGENFGEDKFLTAQFAVSYVLGLQNEGNLTDFSAAFATIKHFLGHGVSEGGRNAGPAMIGKRQLWTEYALPFKTAIQLAGAKGVMPAYNSIDEQPSINDPELFAALAEWGFDGRVVSDDHDIYRSEYWQGTATGETNAISQYLDVGGSVNYADWSTSSWVSSIVGAVASGQIPLSVLQDRVKDVMAVKYDVGLFDNPYLPDNFSIGKTDTQLAQDLALQGARESIILLKNDARLLPLSNSTNSVALIGPFVEYAALGGYAKYGIHARQSTLRQGFVGYLGTDAVSTSWGTSDWLDFRPFIIPYYVLTPIPVRVSNATINNAPTATPKLYANASSPLSPGNAVNSTANLTTALPFFDNDNKNGFFATYYFDTNFSKIAWQTVEGPLLEYNIYPPNAPDGSHILQNVSFSVRWEGYLTSPVTVIGALGVMLNNGHAAMYVNEQLLINTTNSVVTSYCDGPSNFWSHYEANSTNIPTGLAEFEFKDGEVYKIRIDFVSTSTGVVAPAWHLAQRAAPNQSATEASVAQAVEVAAKADLIVLAVGSSPPSDQETCDVSTLTLTPNQTALADAVFALGKPVVLITYGPRPKGLMDYYQKAGAVLRTGYGGQAAGQAMADVIFGAVNPSGKLPLTIPYSVGTVPAYYNHQNGDYHYRYSDIPSRDVDGNLLAEGVYGAENSYNPIYHFGYGLSYTNFTYGKLSSTANTFTSTDLLEFSFTVTNTGDLAGSDVPQLYLLWRTASVAQPVMQLYGFEKISLSPAETKTVNITLDVARYLSGYNRTYDWVVEGTTFTFALMSSSKDATTNNVTLSLVD